MITEFGREFAPKRQFKTKKGESIILKWLLEKCIVKVCTGFSSLMILLHEEFTDRSEHRVQSPERFLSNECPAKLTSSVVGPNLSTLTERRGKKVTETLITASPPPPPAKLFRVEKHLSLTSLFHADSYLLCAWLMTLRQE